MTRINRTQSGDPQGDFSEIAIIYSSDLVTADLVFAEGLDATNPAASLAAVLRPRGLSIIDGPAGSLLVVQCGLELLETALQF